MTDWNPAQYALFERERTQPFVDLLDLIEPTELRLGVDLGCGGGALTVMATDQLGVHTMVGIDSSAAMLESTKSVDHDRVKFRAGDIAEWTSPGDHDLVIANASLQWVPDHAGVVGRWAAALQRGGQIAIQVPANATMPSHLVAAHVAQQEPYFSAFDGSPPADPVAANVLHPEQYARLFFDLGFERQHVRLQVYPHVLPSSRHVVEWVRGTTLTRFEHRLPTDLYRRFIADYETALLAEIGDHQPYFFGFRRILLWARRPA